MNRPFLASIPPAPAGAYRQLSQARHGTAPIFTLSQETLAAMPPLPPVNWASIGQQAPQEVSIGKFGKTQALPAADTIVICWTSAEWAAFDHVFFDSDTPMSYNAIANTASWDDEWLLYARNFSSVSGDLTGDSPSKEVGGWGKFRMANIKGKKILFFKSDMHLHTDGVAIPLINLINQIIDDSKPTLILTNGTAGGTRNQDNLGTVNVTSSAHFLLDGQFQSKPFNNKTFSSSWTTTQAKLSTVNSLLMETPITTAHIEELLAKMNDKLNPKVTLNQVNNVEIKPGAIPPKINLLTTPVLTTNVYGEGNTGGNFADYAAVEMDDAVVGMQAKASSLLFAVLRNISDPVQNAGIPSNVQESWGGSIYNTYGFYSSYNNALATWAVLAQ